MRNLIRRKMLLMAAALCLVAQGAFAMPDCHCAERDTAPPCHQSAPVERDSCCAGEDAPAVPGGCTTAMQSSCCGANVAPATASSAVQVSDQGSDEALVEPASMRSATGTLTPVCAVAHARPPAPPGVPVWLLNATLRN